MAVFDRAFLLRHRKCCHQSGGLGSLIPTAKKVSGCPWKAADRVTKRHGMEPWQRVSTAPATKERHTRLADSEPHYSHTRGLHHLPKELHQRPPAALSRRPQFHRPSRGAKIHQLQAQASECCSLHFDEVEAPQQQGLTRRILVFLKSLEDNLSYWEGDAQHKEQAFKLLLVPDTAMCAIKDAIRQASELIEERQYRRAFEELCAVRHWLYSASSSCGDARLELELDAVPQTTPVLVKTGLPCPKSVVADCFNGVKAAMCALDPKSAEGHMESSERRANVAILNSSEYQRSLPVKNTFIHFDTRPTPPSKRCSSVPSSLMCCGREKDVTSPKASAAAAVISVPCCRPTEEAQETSNEETSKGSLEILPQLSVAGSSMMPLCTSSSTWGVKVHNTFIDVVDDLPSFPVRRSSSAPAQIFHEKLQVELDSQRSRTKHRTRRHKKNCSSSHNNDLPVQAEVDVLQDTLRISVGSGCSSFRLEWTEDAGKILGNLRVLMKRCNLPIGDFVLMLCPERGSTAQKRSNGGPSFKDALGRASFHVKCSSKMLPENSLLCLAVKLQGTGQCAALQLDFLKKSVFWLPKVFDLWGGINACTGMFSLVCTFVVRTPSHRE